MFCRFTQTSFLHTCPGVSPQRRRALIITQSYPRSDGHSIFKDQRLLICPSLIYSYWKCLQVLLSSLPENFEKFIHLYWTKGHQNTPLLSKSIQFFLQV